MKNDDQLILELEKESPQPQGFLGNPESAAVIRTLEKKLLSTETIKRIAESGSLEEAQRLAPEYGFTDPRDFYNALNERLDEVFKICGEISDYRVIKLVAAKRDFNNLKIAVKNFLLNQTSFPYSDNPEYEKLFQSALERYKEKSDPQIVSIYLDKKMFKTIKKLADELDSELINEYVEASIDAYNIKTMLRCKIMEKDAGFFNALVIGGGKIDVKDLYQKSFDFIKNKLCFTYLGCLKEGFLYFENRKNMSRLDKALDDYLTGILRKSKYLPYGNELAFAYLLSAENEVKNLRIAFTGLANKNPEAKERLRLAYA
jgi:V/A-type H+-transporting ATPase subunit C